MELSLEQASIACQDAQLQKPSTQAQMISSTTLKARMLSIQSLKVCSLFIEHTLPKPESQNPDPPPASENNYCA